MDDESVDMEPIAVEDPMVVRMVVGSDDVHFVDGDDEPDVDGGDQQELEQQHDVQHRQDEHDGHGDERMVSELDSRPFVVFSSLVRDPGSSPSHGLHDEHGYEVLVVDVGRVSTDEMMSMVDQLDDCVRTTHYHHCL